MTRYYRTRTGRTVEERSDNFHETLAPSSRYYATETAQPAAYNSGTSRAVSGVERIMNAVAGIISTLLAIRFVLSLLNANQLNGFVNFVYAVTDPIVKPFANAFSYTVATGTGYFDLPALVALTVVGLIAWAVTRLVRLARA